MLGKAKLIVLHLQLDLVHPKLVNHFLNLFGRESRHVSQEGDVCMLLGLPAQCRICRRGCCAPLRPTRVPIPFAHASASLALAFSCLTSNGFTPNPSESRSYPPQA